jgi:hypothetical protein
VTLQQGDIPQIVAFDNDGLLGDHIHIFGTTPDLGKKITALRIIVSPRFVS